MTIKKEGSALLVTITVMTVLLVYMATVWQAARYSYEIVQQRTALEKQYWVTQALMLWAVALAKENFDSITNLVKSDPKELLLKKWPLWSKKPSRARVNSSMLNEDALKLSVALETKQKKERVFSCALERIKKNDQEIYFTLKEWHES